jgi:nucleotide-binding universal stress UspA family protein
MNREIVVVGVDESPQSRAALDWAASYARRTGASLHAVAVHPTSAPGYPYAVGVAGAPLVSEGSWRKESEAEVAALYYAIRPEPHWTLTQLAGSPGPELVRLARGADLLVVGTREHVGFDRFLEGSVSRYCLHHADVPVVAVPLADDRAPVS